jgi:hypothetical protein
MSERRHPSSPQPDQPTMPATYTTSWDLTDPIDGPSKLPGFLHSSTTPRARLRPSERQQLRRAPTRFARLRRQRGRRWLRRREVRPTLDRRRRHSPELERRLTVIWGRSSSGPQGCSELVEELERSQGTRLPAAVLLPYLVGVPTIHSDGGILTPAPRPEVVPTSRGRVLPSFCSTTRVCGLSSSALPSLPAGP